MNYRVKSPSRQWWQLIAGTSLAAAVFLYLILSKETIANSGKSIIAGITVVFFAFGVALPVFGSGGWTGIFMGDDNRPSTSKFQFFLWTVAAFFTLTAYMVFNLLRHPDTFNPVSIDPYLITAMGLSGGTAVLAKGITSVRESAGPGAKTAVKDGDPGHGLAALVTDDSLQPDLTKIQLVTWTVVAVAFFLGRSLEQLFAGKDLLNALPGIEPALVVLSGIAAGTYIGGKLVPATSPRLTPTTLHGKPGDRIVLVGEGFGDKQGGSVLTLDGREIPLPISEADWKANAVTFTVPNARFLRDNGLTPPLAFEARQLGILVNGNRSANTVPCLFDPGVGETTSPETAPAPVAGATGARVKITGDYLSPAPGAAQRIVLRKPNGTSEVSANFDPADWKPDEVTFTVPVGVSAGESYKVILSADGRVYPGAALLKIT